MNFEEINRVYFIGIGGIGMSALARWFCAEHKSVSGYDRTRTSLTDRLEEEGIPVNYSDSPGSIPEEIRENPAGCLIVYTPAIPRDSEQLKYFFDHGFQIHKRSEVLGAVTHDHFTIAVAGTHGKTTTSSMIAHILHTAGRKLVAFLGGILQNYNSNLILDIKGEGDWLVVVEADEYDRSFLRLDPDIAVITAADPDHLDIYGTVESMREAFAQFAGKIRKNGKLFIRKGVLEKIPVKNESGIEIHEFRLDHSPIRAASIKIEREEMRFDFIAPDIQINNIPLSQPGNHNVENAVAAIAVCLLCGVTEGQIKEAFSTYRGIKRRFEYIIMRPDLTFIDDYAHHPEEIRAFLSAVRAMYPHRYITAVFQPHLFTRTRDLAPEFAESLSLADEVILLDIYPARELPIEGVTSALISAHLPKETTTLCNKEELAGLLENKKIDVLTTIGAGDIDKMVGPIKELLMARA